MQRIVLPYIAPSVLIKAKNVEKSMDLFSRLLNERIVFVSGAIDINPETYYRYQGSNFITNDVASRVIAQILYLQFQNKSQDIHLYINSTGGAGLWAPLAIYDTMQFSPCEINTYCMGQVVGMAAVLLAGGAKGKRYALPNTRIMLHQPLDRMSGAASDIEIRAKEIKRQKRRMMEILAKHTGKSLEEIEKDADRDFYMSAKEAKEYGLVDEVIERLKSEKDDSKK
jgi:ATP-dependent Clp protease protease subunit